MSSSALLKYPVMIYHYLMLINNFASPGQIIYESEQPFQIHKLFYLQSKP